jgi:hypothetical protein
VRRNFGPAGVSPNAVHIPDQFCLKTARCWTTFPERETEARVGKLHQVGKVIITVYANDHLPPHFHAVGPDDEALIEIKTLNILAGGLSAKVERDVMAWATAHKSDLAAEWNRINPRFPIA